MTGTHMRREILEIPAAIETLLMQGAPATRAAAEALRARNPAFFATVARGSSDNAATSFKYASELLLGIPVASLGPSIASVYRRPIGLANSACIAVSQSGKSPDIVEMSRSTRDAGALTLALTNDHGSELADACDQTLCLHAGPERSVAATKTFVASCVAALWLVAELADDADLRAAIFALPETLGAAAEADWSLMGAATQGQSSLFCLGRGPTLAMSDEAALKFKETCLIHGESYSSAEVLHGPVSIVGEGFPILAFGVPDAAEDLLLSVTDDLVAKGASVFVTSEKAGRATALHAIRTAHPLTDPLPLIVSFYAMVEQIARDRGIDPDTPRHLNKVTRTR